MKSSRRGVRVILTELGREVDSDPRRTDEQIRRRLRRRLIAYDQEFVDSLRALTQELRREARRGDSSDYYTGSHGPCADWKDFDTKRWTHDVAQRHPDLALSLLRGAVDDAVFWGYLR